MSLGVVGRQEKNGGGFQRCVNSVSKYGELGPRSLVLLQTIESCF